MSTGDATPALLSGIPATRFSFIKIMLKVLSARRSLVGVVAGLLVLGGSVAGARGSVASTADQKAIAIPESPARAEPLVSAADAILAIPVAGITRRDLRDTFGAPRGPSRTHQAIDILAARGTPAVAAVDGTVLKLFDSRAGGRTVYLTDPAGEWIYYYAHLDRYARGLDEGDVVRRGETIGYVGTTGNAPESVPHLHFAIERMPVSGEWWKGESTNPFPILLSRGMTVR